MTRARRTQTRAQALAEFAIVLPLFVFLMLMLLDAARAVFVYNGLTNAAREGARLAIVNQDPDLVGERVEKTLFGGSVSNLGDGTLVRYHKKQPNADALSNIECDPITVGCVAVVMPRTSWSLITPFLGSAIGPMTFEARSELPVELVCPSAVYPLAEDCPKQP
jgi:hypothetical protein